MSVVKGKKCSLFKVYENNIIYIVSVICVGICGFYVRFLILLYCVLSGYEIWVTIFLCGFMKKHTFYLLVKDQIYKVKESTMEWCNSRKIKLMIVKCKINLHLNCDSKNYCG